MAQRLLTIEEASEKLRLSVATLYKYSCQKKIPVVRLGARLLFSDEALDKWIKRNSIEPIANRNT